MARVVCFGELLLRLSAPGREKLLQSPQLEVRIGGAEANVGVSLSCFGHQVAAVGTVADNALGEAAAGELRRYGVDTTGLRKVAGRMGLYFLAPGAIHRPAEVLYDRADSAFALAAADGGWSVRELEERVRNEQAAKTAGKTDGHKKPGADPNITRLEQDLSEKLATRVSIQHARNGRGKLVIAYHSIDELDGILERIR